LTSKAFLKGTRAPPKWPPPRDRTMIVRFLA
jgi:hypothetical protein